MIGQPNDRPLLVIIDTIWRGDTNLSVWGENYQILIDSLPKLLYHFRTVYRTIADEADAAGRGVAGGRCLYRMLLERCVVSVGCPSVARGSSQKCLVHAWFR